MATVYTDVGQNQADADDASKGLSDRAAGNNTAGGLHIATATYTVTAALSASGPDVINVVKLPAGARVIPQLSRLHTDGVGATTCTLDLGDETDPNRYATAIDVNSASTTQGGIAWDEEVAGEALYETPSGGEWFQATVAALTGTATADRLLSFKIVYALSS